MKNFLFLLSFLCFYSNIYSQIWDGDAMDNDWNNPTNWDTDLVPAVGALVVFPQSVDVISTGAVAPPAQVIVRGAGTIVKFDLDLTIGNGFTAVHSIQINSNASLIIGAGRTINLFPPNANNAINNGTTTVNASMTVEAGANLNIIIANRGLHLQSSSFLFTNNGTILIASCNNDGINLGPGATFNNNGNLTIGATNREGIDNSGVFNNDGDLIISSSNTKGIYNKPSGIFSNSGAITITDLSVPATTDDGIFSLGSFQNELTGEIIIGSMLDDAIEAQGGTFTNSGSISLSLPNSTTANHIGLSVGSTTTAIDFINDGTIEVVNGSNTIGRALAVFPGPGGANPVTTFTNNGMIILNDGIPNQRFFTQGVSVNGPTGTINTGTGRINVNLNTFQNNGLIVSNYPTLPGVFTALTGLSTNDGFYRTNSSSFSNGTAANITNNGIDMNDPAQTTFDLGGNCTVTVGGAGAAQLWNNSLGNLVGGPGPNLMFSNAFPDVSSATISASVIDVTLTLTNICAAAILPIELTRFTATPKEKSVMLAWETASEINNDYMAVERSSDARSFTEIGKIAGAGNSNSILRYQLEDTAPHNGINYYRLRQVDYDGTINYSNIVSATFNGKTGLPSLNLYPNVVKSGGSMEIDLTNFPQQPMTFRILNSQGQIMNNFSLVGGTRQSIETGNLPAGIYFLINTNTATKSSTKFVVTD
ncbi:T9SS type A sorting domain-containing protein [Lewinella sp. LCG006]|uniref:T9SS type A sorting domain-containing protein n=1 Tax=Lewinella sp. LCG006 TaxID=3231911 RepID=UPI00346152DC